MSRSNSHSADPHVPEEVVARHRADWHAFTGWTVKTCVAVAIVLLLMLVFLRIL